MEMSVETPQEVQVGAPIVSELLAPKVEISGKWSDFASDMAKLADEQGQAEASLPLAQPVPAVELQAVPTQPEQPQAVVTQPEVKPEAKPVEAKVPDKFLRPDGTPDVERLTKSYLAAEKELKRAQNRAPQAPQAPQLSQSAPEATPETTPFAAQLDKDIQQYGAGRVLERLFSAAKDAARSEALQEVHGLREKAEDESRVRELEAIAKRDPFVFSEEGLRVLTAYRQDKPWINASPEPWKEAYRQYLADRQERAMTQTPGQQVSTPNPTKATAPITPVAAAGRVMSAPTVKLDSKEDILTYVKTLKPEQEAEFWKKSGFKWSQPAFAKGV